MNHKDSDLIVEQTSPLRVLYSITRGLGNTFYIEGVGLGMTNEGNESLERQANTNSRHDVLVDMNTTDDSYLNDSGFVANQPMAETSLSSGGNSNGSGSTNSSTEEIPGCENSRNILLGEGKMKEDENTTDKRWDCCDLWKTYGDEMSSVPHIIFLLANFGYLIYSMYYDWTKASTLLALWIIAVILCVIKKLKSIPSIKRFLLKCFNLLPRSTLNNAAKWSISLLMILACLIIWIVIDTRHRIHQLIPLLGYFIFMFLLYVFSKHRTQIKWRPVVGGVCLQLTMGFVVIRSSFGFAVFRWIANLAQQFLSYVDKGSEFVFGSDYAKHYFAFRVLPIIIYFSACISILYHLGVMQRIIRAISMVMQSTIGTSAAESMVAAGNIFVGQTESPLLIRPYLKDLTLSEMHAVMTAGFGTIAGSVLGAYLGFGVKAISIISACVMAAPCALAVSKLVYPETDKSKFKTFKDLVIEKSEYKSVIEAAFAGASNAIPLVLNIAANLIAFLSLLAMINGFLGWYGGLSGHPDLSFQMICSYIFIPVSYLMGVEWADCFKVAELLGTKIFLNEFIAYSDMKPFMDSRENGTIPKFDEEGNILWLSIRSETITTYALCGFANMGSIGIMLGGLSALCPERQKEMVKIVLRALVAGVFVSILNACIAGFLYVPPPVNCTWIYGANEHWMYTSNEDLNSCCMGESPFNQTNTTSNLFRNAVCCNETFPINVTAADC